MPEEVVNPVPSIPEVQKKSNLSLKNTLTGVTVGILLMILGLGGFYFYLNQNTTNSGSTVSNNVATSSAKQDKKVVNSNTIVWIQKSDIWVKEEGKDAKKIYTETKKILDWDILGNGKIVYITATEKFKDEVYGTAIVSLDLKTLAKETLYEKSVDQILAEKPKSDGTCNFDDTDISALAVSKDEKSIAYAASGIFLLGVSSKKIDPIVKTSAFVKDFGNNTFHTANGDVDNVGNCITYSKVNWVNLNLLEVGLYGWESGRTDVLDIKNKTVIDTVGYGEFHTTFQISYPPSEPLFIDNNNNEPVGAIIRGKTILPTYYSTKSLIIERVVDGDKVYFVEEPQTKSSMFSLNSFSLSTKKVQKLLDSQTETNYLYGTKCLVNDNGFLFYQAEEVKGTVNIYKLDTKTKEKSLVGTVTYYPKKETATLGCFKLTTL